MKWKRGKREQEKSAPIDWEKIFEQGVRREERTTRDSVRESVFFVEIQKLNQRVLDGNRHMERIANALETLVRHQTTDMVFMTDEQFATLQDHDRAREQAERGS